MCDLGTTEHVLIVAPIMCLTIFHIQGWMIGFDDFVCHQKGFVFVELKVTSKVAAHLVILESSVFKQIAAARGLSTAMKRQDLGFAGSSLTSVIAS